MPELFLRFGGHAHAAGVTLDAARVTEFRERFNAYAAAKLSPDDFLRRINIDAIIELREINDRSIDEVFALAPFGHGNEAPLFAATSVEVAGPPVVFKENHLRLNVKQNGRGLTLKAWNFASRLPELPQGARIDIAFQLEEDPYSAARGYPNWCATLRDFRATL
jgi:single-stranded-DNA-specific exonuclease